MAMTNIKRDKRKPPTFHHVPQARAKQLKKAWVAKQKTKSKWKAQKRREGILTQRDAAGTLSDSPKTSQLSVREERVKSPDKAESNEHGDGSQSSSEDEPAPIVPVQKNKQKMRGQEEDISTAVPSLRQLQRQAYSPAALHHYKSHPLQRSKGRKATYDARVPGSSQKKDGEGGTRNLSRRGGQPDMRLRMSAMLEKIKRDY